MSGTHEVAAGPLVTAPNGGSVRESADSALPTGDAEEAVIAGPGPA